MARSLAFILANHNTLLSWVVQQEVSDVQRTVILNPTAEDYAMAAVVRDSFGEGAKQNLAKRKLDSVGNVRSS